MKFLQRTAAPGEELIIVPEGTLRCAREVFESETLGQLVEYYAPPFPNVAFGFPDEQLVISVQFGDDERGQVGFRAAVFTEEDVRDNRILKKGTGSYMACMWLPGAEDNLVMSTFTPEEILDFAAEQKREEASGKRFARIIIALSEEDMIAVASRILLVVAFLGHKDFHDRHSTSMAKVNGAHKKTYRDYVEIRPSSAVRDFMEPSTEREGGVILHKVRGHKRNYTTGNRIEGYRKVKKLLKPFLRGNPDKGVSDKPYIMRPK